MTNEILDHLSDSQSPRNKCCRRHCCYCHRVPLSCGVVCPHLNEVLCKHSAGEKRAVFMKSGLFTTHRVKCLASPELVYYYQAIWISSICLIHLLIKSSAGAVPSVRGLLWALLFLFLSAWLEGCVWYCEGRCDLTQQRHKPFTSAKPDVYISTVGFANHHRQQQQVDQKVCSPAVGWWPAAGRCTSEYASENLWPLLW